MNSPFIQYIGRLLLLKPSSPPKMTFGYKRWTDEEKKFIIENYATKGRKFCADSLDRSVPSIARIAGILNCQAECHYTKSRNMSL